MTHLDTQGMIDVLRDEREVAAIETLRTVLRRIVGNPASDVADQRCSADPRWAEVVDAAAIAWEVLTD